MSNLMNQQALVLVSSCYFLVTCSYGLGEGDTEEKGELDVWVMIFLFLLHGNYCKLNLVLQII